jgi:hypothetical protein
MNRAFRPHMSRRGLTAIGLVLGLKRRWFGLEPDFLFRERVYAVWNKEISPWPTYTQGDFFFSNDEVTK